MSLCGQSTDYLPPTTIHLFSLACATIPETTHTIQKVPLTCSPSRFHFRDCQNLRHPQDSQLRKQILHRYTQRAKLSDIQHWIFAMFTNLFLCAYSGARKFVYYHARNMAISMRANEIDLAHVTNAIF